MVLDIGTIIPVGMKKKAAITLGKSLWTNLKNAGGYISKEELAQLVPLCFTCKEVRSLVSKKIQENLDQETIMKTQNNKEDLSLVFHYGDEEVYIASN